MIIPNHFVSIGRRLTVNCSFTLVRYPRVLAKLREEIAQACQGKPNLTRSDLRNMTYLQNVIKESKLSYLALRLSQTEKTLQLISTMFSASPLSFGPCQHSHGHNNNNFAYWWWSRPPRPSSYPQRLACRI